MGELEYSAKEYIEKAIDIALKNKEKGMKKMSLIFEEECMKVAEELFRVKDEISYKMCVAHVMALLDFYKRLMQKGKRMMLVDMYELDKKDDEKENTKEKEDKEEMPILEKLYRASQNPTIFMSNEKLFELFPVDDRIEYLQDEIRSYCCKLNKEDEEDKEDYYKYLLSIFKIIKEREQETDE